MQKKKFINMLKDSILDEKIKNEYINKFENILTGVNPESNLDGVMILDAFESKNTFEFFVRNHDEDEVKELLNNLSNELKKWVPKYIAVNTESAANTISNLSHATKILSYKDDWNKRTHHKKHIIFIILITLFILFSLLAATFSLLDVLKVISFGGTIASICGVLDFINGVVFFVIERIDDIKKKTMDDDCDKDLHSGSNNITIHIEHSKIDNRTIKIKKVGNGNTIINGDVNNKPNDGSLNLDDFLFPKNK